MLDLQHDALIAAGVEPTHIYLKQVSGSKDDRPQLGGDLLRALRKDDVLVIWKLDRLGRNLRHLIETIDDLTKRGVGFKVLQGAPVDTTTSQGKLMFTMFAALAEFEHDVIRERTIAGLAAARARGREGGRKSAFDKNMLARAQAGVRDHDVAATPLCAELGISWLALPEPNAGRRTDRKRASVSCQASGPSRETETKEGGSLQRCRHRFSGRERIRQLLKTGAAYAKLPLVTSPRNEPISARVLRRAGGGIELNVSADTMPPLMKEPSMGALLVFVFFAASDTGMRI